jgi:hypothetical protein
MLAAALRAVRAVDGSSTWKASSAMRSTTSGCPAFPSRVTNSHDAQELGGPAGYLRAAPVLRRVPARSRLHRACSRKPRSSAEYEDGSRRDEGSRIQRHPVAGGLAQSHSATGPWSLCRVGIPRCALATGKDPGQTRRNGDRPWLDGTPLTTQSESARSGGGILLGHMSRTGRDETA